MSAEPQPPPPRLTPLVPFGVVVQLAPDTEMSALPPEQIHAWVEEHRVVVLRGLRPIERMALPLAARRLGPLQAWSFGSVHELRVKPGTDNYLYTAHEVPLHWDGAFAGEAPRYLVFQCVEAPGEGAGGETVFVDTARVWNACDTETRGRYRALRFRYATERRAHYGGSFDSPLVTQHEVRGDTVLRFAEPVDDLNAVSVEALGLDPLRSAELVAEIGARLRDPAVRLAHPWQANDVVIADNLGLLHGRTAFARHEPRLIRRVNVHVTRSVSIVDQIRNALRIRRLEFMAAEIPIFLIPALLSRRMFDGWQWLELGVLFFLLFHVGDMVNCLADRELDAVYKTRLSEAVYALGPRNVALQTGASCVLATALSAEISRRAGDWVPLGLVVAGLLLGLQYSLRPLYFKGRGVLQIGVLWAIIFMGPMALVWYVLTRRVDAPAFALFASYGVMQQGIVLVNTAEDIPEDRACGIRTSAIALGLDRSLAAACVMVVLGGAAVSTLLAGFLTLRGRPVVLSLMPLLVAIGVVANGVLRARSRARSAADEGRAIEAMRPYAKRVPIWISLTALGTLLAALAYRC